MSARIAILVLAHDPQPLQYLLDTLDARFRVFIHMDAKTDLTTLADSGLRLPEHATLVGPRVAVFWGGYSMMQATLLLVQAALAEAAFERLVLISGDSLPVRPPEELEAALLDGHDRIELIEVPDDPGLAGRPAAEAEAAHGWTQPWRFHNLVHWDHLLLNPATREAAGRHYRLDQHHTDWLRGDAQALVRGVLEAMPPRPRIFPRLRYGTQWWALSGETLRAMLPRLLCAPVQAYFRHFEVPDEHMIHTVLVNPPPGHVSWPGLGERLASPVWTDHASRARGVDTLDAAGFAHAAAQGPHILFARKFSPAATPELAAALRAGRGPVDSPGIA